MTTWIFDLDGTLLDTIETISYYGNETLKFYGKEPMHRKEYEQILGWGPTYLVQEMIKKRRVEQPFEEVLENYLERYHRDTTHLTKPFEGFEAVLWQLKRRKDILAVYSNKQHPAVVRVVEAFFGKDLFDLVWGSRAEIPTKPSPIGVFRLLDALGQSVETAVYVGDTEIDLETARASNIPFIGVDWGFRSGAYLREMGCVDLIREPKELLERGWKK